VFPMVSAGSNHTCGVTLDGVAYCWGKNSSGQLGNGTTTNSRTPVPVSGALSFATVSAGANHTCGATSAIARAKSRCQRPGTRQHTLTALPVTGDPPRLRYVQPVGPVSIR
jgi:Regulator of chromosome condensation (RCC1) repeat